MIDGRRVLGLIPARGGSKGLPGKNTRPLAGKPLLAWTAEAARASETIDRVVLSTDSAEIAAVGEAYGCEVPFMRPAHLAADDTPGVAPVLHALGELPGFDYVVLLQPTSPLRVAADIDGAVRAGHNAGAETCVSVSPTGKPPRWTFWLGEGDRLEPIMPGEAASRRQDARVAYALNGAVYVAAVEPLRRTERLVTPETMGYAMPPERSADVDTKLDIAWCEFLLASGVAPEVHPDPRAFR